MDVWRFQALVRHSSRACGGLGRTHQAHIATVAMEVELNGDRMQKSNWSDTKDFLRLLCHSSGESRANSQVR